MKTTNKIRTYEVYCDFDTNGKARRFAERLAFERTVVEVRSRKRWFKADPKVIVTFKTEECGNNVYKWFIDEFKEYNLEIVGRQLYVYNKMEEGS